MLLESFILRKFTTLERFITNDNTDNSGITTEFIILIVTILVISLLYTGGAISLSWNYNNYIGTTGGVKLLYAILVFIAPTIYYPFYAIVLNPIKKLKVSSKTV
jgi:hypothetical protein